jgi:hypothetical protein
MSKALRSIAGESRKSKPDRKQALNGEDGLAEELPDRPLVTGEDMTVDDLHNCTLESLQALTDFGLRSLIEHSRHLQAMATIVLDSRTS